MTNKSILRLIKRLDTLLDEERSALLNGDLDAIGPLLSRKEELFDALNSFNAEAQADVAPLRDKAVRNQALLDSALQGIRAVTGRLAEFRKIRRTLETYDRTGQKTAISDIVDHTMEKRA